MSKRTKKQRAINVQPPTKRPPQVAEPTPVKQPTFQKVEPLTHGMPPAAPAAPPAPQRTTDLHGTYCGLTTKLTDKTAILQLVGLDDYVKAQFDDVGTGLGYGWQGGFRKDDFKLDVGCKWPKS